MPTRLRIFDLQTPWFWLLVFAQRTFDKPRIELAVWPPNGDRWWVNVWEREPIPDERGAYAEQPEVPRGKS